MIIFADNQPLNFFAMNMKKQILILIGSASLVSCGIPKAQFEELQKKSNNLEARLNDANKELAKAQGEKSNLESRLNALNEKTSMLLSTNQVLMDNMGNLSALGKKGAENLEKSLESLREKDMRIRSLQEAMNLKDSISFAVVKSLKGSLDNMDDEDVEVNVDKGVIFISISDKMLFATGSTTVTDKAKGVLSKVAKILKDKPDFEFIVEGHTDNVPIKTASIKDNWDLSALRATSIVRILQNTYKIDPARMSAAGRSEYVNIADNSSPEGKAKNRRIKIILIPKVDQFFGMVEQTLNQK